jgi:hypothetical protein
MLDFALAGAMWLDFALVFSTSAAFAAITRVTFQKY